MDVAVVVPVYNGAAFLAQTLASVAAQTHRVAELIVVDDGSDDGSDRIADDAGATVVRQQNSGPAAARNRGVAEAASELVAFLDADDTFVADKIARQLEPLAAAPELVGVCSDGWIRGGPRDGQRKNAGREVPARLTRRELLRGNPVIASSVLVRRRAVLEVGGFDEDPVLIATEDYDLWLRLLAAADNELAYLDEPLVEYRVHGDSLSDSQRFLAGLDRIMSKVVVAADPGDEETRALAAQCRAGARIDAAWDLAHRGRGAEARAQLRAARELSGTSWKARKIWLRSWL